MALSPRSSESGGNVVAHRVLIARKTRDEAKVACPRLDAVRSRHSLSHDLSIAMAWLADADSTEQLHLIHERLDARRVDWVFELAVDLERRADHRAVGDRELPLHIVDPTSGVAEDDCVRHRLLD